MKKSFSILAFAGLLAIVSCGQSEQEKMAMEKKKQDSIAKADSVNAASIANEAMQKVKQDSAAAGMDKAKTDSTAMAGDSKDGMKK